MGHLDDAIDFLEKALDIYLKVDSCGGDFNPGQFDFGRIYYSLGIARFLRGEYDLSEILIEEALSIWQSLYGHRHVITAKAVDALGKIHLAKGCLDDSFSAHEKALRVKGVLMGSRHPTVLFSMINMASALRLKGEWDKSLKMFECIARVQEDRIKEPNGNTALSLIDFGNTLHLMGKLLTEMDRAHDGARELARALIYYKSAGLDAADRRVVSLMEYIQSLPDCDCWHIQDVCSGISV